MPSKTKMNKEQTKLAVTAGIVAIVILGIVWLTGGQSGGGGTAVSQDEVQVLSNGEAVSSTGTSLEAGGYTYAPQVCSQKSECLAYSPCDKYGLDLESYDCKPWSSSSYVARNYCTYVCKPKSFVTPTSCDGTKCTTACKKMKYTKGSCVIVGAILKSPVDPRTSIDLTASICRCTR